MIRLVVGVVLVLFNAAFVATEFAIIASRSTLLEGLAEQGNRRARLAVRAMRRLSLQLAGAQLGVTMASLGLGYVAEPAAEHLLESLLSRSDLPEGVVRTISLVVALSVVATIHTVVGEAIPKNLAISAPEKTLMALVLPYRGYLLVFRPVIRVLTWIANRLTRMLGVEPREELHGPRSAEDIVALLSASRREGLIEEFEHDLLTLALAYDERPVTVAMIPWEQVVTVPQGATATEVEAVVHRTGHTRLPVVGRATGAGVVGFVHAKDLLRLNEGVRDRALPPGLVRRLITVPPTTTLEELVARMRQLRTHVAVVVAPGSHPEGLVTLEDLLEELVGEISDETDPEVRQRALARTRRLARAQPAATVTDE